MQASVHPSRAKVEDGALDSVSSTMIIEKTADTYGSEWHEVLCVFVFQPKPKQRASDVAKMYPSVVLHFAKATPASSRFLVICAHTER